MGTFKNYRAPTTAQNTANIFPQIFNVISWHLKFCFKFSWLKERKLYEHFQVKPTKGNKQRFKKMQKLFIQTFFFLTESAFQLLQLLLQQNVA